MGIILFVSFSDYYHPKTDEYNEERRVSHDFGGKRLYAALQAPLGRVVVRDDVKSFIAAGKNLFCRHVTGSDPGIHAGDEVIVVDGQGQFIAIGEAVLSGYEMAEFSTGMAVSVRHGSIEEEKS